MIYASKMKSSAQSFTAPCGFYNVASPEGDALFELQLRVARRADVLARGWPVSPDLDRVLWLRGEQEIFENVERVDSAGSFRRTAIAI